jgi:hypothetical protein
MAGPTFARPKMKRLAFKTGGTLASADNVWKIVDDQHNLFIVEIGNSRAWCSFGTKARLLSGRRRGLSTQTPMSKSQVDENEHDPPRQRICLQPRTLP